MIKKYQVILQDEYNNLYMVGFFDELDDSIEEINKYLDIYEVQLKKGDLKIHTNTYGKGFDTELSDLFEGNEKVEGIMIRGFIY